MEELPSKKVVYHGTNLFAAKAIIQYGIWLDIQRRLTDFGPGFYVTFDPDQAIKWALVKTNQPQVYKNFLERLDISFDDYINHPDTQVPACLCFDLDQRQLKLLNGRSYPLPQQLNWPFYEKEWELFVKNCRNSQRHYFDYVYGPIGKKHTNIPLELLFSKTKDQLSLNSQESVQCLSQPKVITLKDVQKAPWYKHILQPTSFLSQRSQQDLLRSITQELMKLGQLTHYEADTILKNFMATTKFQTEASLLLLESPTYWTYCILLGNETLWYEEYESYLIRRQNG